MAYVPQGPWTDYDQLTPEQLTAMDEGIAAASRVSYVSKGKVSGSITLDAAEADVFGLVLTGDTTISLASMATDGELSKVRIALNSNMHAVTWADSITWESALPSLAGNPDMITIQRAGDTGPLLGRHDGTFGQNEGTLPAIGDDLCGGIYAGIMDTTRGDILPGDYWQVGQRYALILYGKLNVFSQFYAGQLLHKPEESLTTWNGLGSSLAFKEIDDAYYTGTSPSYNSIPGYVTTLPVPPDGASQLYVPALEEMLLLYRSFKPTSAGNYPNPPVGWAARPDHNMGYNPSSDPAGADFDTYDPAMTSVAKMQATYNAPGWNEYALGMKWQSPSPDLEAPFNFTSTAYEIGVPSSDPNQLGSMYEMNVQNGAVWYDAPGWASLPPGNRIRLRTVRRLLLPA